MSHPSPVYRVSSLITFAPAIPRHLVDAAKLALAGIDDVHHVPKFVSLALHPNRKRREQGSYDPRLCRIEISRHAIDPIATVIHETAHYLDNRILHPLPTDYASRYDQDFDPLMLACMQSQSVRAIAKSLRGKHSGLSRSDAAFLKEALEPHEIFARAYFQWICTKSNVPLLRNCLRRRCQMRSIFGGHALVFQWDPADFADIMDEIEQLFRLKGLI